MVNDRQQVADDLAAPHAADARCRARTRAHATRGFRASCGARSSTMDENDLNTRMQRSSDWLRSGNFSDPAGSRPSPATCKNWASRSATRPAPWAALNLPRTPHSTAPWTIYRGCATSSPASADVPALNLDKGNSGPRGQQFQTGQLSRNGQSGQGGQQAGQSGNRGGKAAEPGNLGNRAEQTAQAIARLVQ